jgi:hypothetical protein
MGEGVTEDDTGRMESLVRNNLLLGALDRVD